ncbi:hypothetical protein [Actinoplanes sp. NPDC089786]|uniref:hypothetical protein n=1 Tax=Actinoplanes sp. NPDC089786 TaxID=3155185 RepID=UPI003446A096
MTGSNHRANCANAKNPGCVCSGCGGALHGWHGWTELAADTDQARLNRRVEIEAKVERDRHTGLLGFNTRNRQAFIDLARLDLADYLSRSSPPTPPAGPVLPQVDLSNPTTFSSDFGKLNTLAGTVMAEAWGEIEPKIEAQVGDKRTANEVKKQLANHTWCTLLVTLIRWLEQVKDTLQVVADAGKRLLERALTKSLTGLSKALASIVVGIVIDKVWSILARLLEAHFPLLGEDSLRVLRILAVFTCPSIEHHPAVYKYTVRPLTGDALNLISQDVKDQVATLFNAWWHRRCPEAIA